MGWGARLIFIALILMMMPFVQAYDGNAQHSPENAGVIKNHMNSGSRQVIKPKYYYTDNNILFKYSNNYHYYQEYQNSHYRRGYYDGWDDGYNYRKPARYDRAEYNEYTSDRSRRTVYVSRPISRSTSYTKVSGTARTGRYAYSNSAYRYAPGTRFAVK